MPSKILPIYARFFVGKTALRLVLPCVIASAAFPASGLAATDTWTGTVSTDWGTAENWSLSTVPTSSDNPYINTGTASVSSSGGTSQDVYVANSASNTGTLLITSGGTLSSGYGNLAISSSEAIGVAVVSGTGSAWTMSSNFLVGVSGIGSVTVSNAGTVSSAGGYMGHFSGSNGSATITGSGSAWTLSQTLFIGYNGTGTLNVSDQGAVSAYSLYMGQNSGSSGSGTITGSGSTVTLTMDLGIGMSGTGNLTIEQSGHVSNKYLYVGHISGSNGTLTINSGGELSSSGSAYIGYNGTGTLIVSDQGTFSASSVYFGQGSGSSGSGTITGSESTVTLSMDLGIGMSGTGSLTIEQSGHASNNFSYIGYNSASSGTLTINSGGTLTSLNTSYVGYNSGSQGTVTVSGTDSRWTVGDSLLVGRTGTGLLTISDEGTVAVTLRTYLGYNTGSSGSVTVSGTGSTLSGELTVGRAGTGVLTLTESGTADAGSSTVALASNSGSHGTLNIGAAAGSPAATAGTLISSAISVGSGTGRIFFNHTSSDYTFSQNISGGGTLTAAAGTTRLTGNLSGFTGTIKVGYTDSSGALIFSGGNTASSSIAYIGSGTGSTGSVTVTGNGTNWTTTSGLTTGCEGNGSISIADGADVTSQYSTLGYTDEITGTATVAGSGSTWTTNGNFIVGRYGSGSLTISDGGTATASYSSVGRYDGSSGTLTVSGTGSSFSTTQYIYVGNEGSGLLEISDGGHVTASTDVYVGNASDSTGTATVTGAGSTLTAANVLSIGFSGSGTLTVSDGGVVSSSYGQLGNSEGATGTATITGSGSRWTTTNTLLVGYDGGEGTLTISDKGIVSAESYASIAVSQGASGTVYVTGSGSTFSQSTVLYVGYQGSGVLSVSNGGSVLTHSAAYIGFKNLAVGTATVSGMGSSWTVSESIHIGSAATGTLNVLNGGSVSTDSNAYIGHDQIGIGTATISGTGSLWTLGGSLRVGFNGNGTLNISDGGFVSAGTNSFIGYSDGSTGRVTVSGPESRLSTGSSNLDVGYGGSGTLTIADGGTVSVANGYAINIAFANGSSGTLNIGTAAGSPAAAAGTVDAANIVFGSGSGTIVFNHTSASYAFTPNITGNGTIEALAGATSLTGDLSAFIGTTQIKNNARLVFNGTYGGSVVVSDASTFSADASVAGTITVGNEGTLKGRGTVGAASILSGGTVAPGNSIGTLHVAGNMTFSSGSTYEVETNASGDSDLIAVGGTTTILGGTVRFVGPTYLPGHAYTVLTSGGGVTGTFDAASAASLFLTPTLGYGANSVTATLSRNAVSFASTAVTPNQREVATAFDGITTTNDLVISLMGQSSVANVQDAYRGLSGELHSGIRSAIAADVGRTFNFLDQAFAHKDTGRNIWMLPYANIGKRYGDNVNVFQFRQASVGTLFGGDGEIKGTENWRMGGAFGIGRTDYELDSLPGNLARGHSDNYTLAAYGSYRTDNLAFRLGATYAFHRIHTDRNISVVDYSAWQKATYGAHSIGGFGEASYILDTGAETILEPFLRVTYGHAFFPGFSEDGGDGALSARADTVGQAETTLGVRGSQAFGFSDSAPFSAGCPDSFLCARLREKLGWTRLIGAATPKGKYAFDSSPWFHTSGARAGQDALSTALSLDVTVTDNLNVGIVHSGVFSVDSTNQAFQGNLRWNF